MDEEKIIGKNFFAGTDGPVGERTPGSVRVDIVLNDAGRPIAAYDLKIGKAILTESRVRTIREAIGVPGVKVIELRYDTGTSILR